MAKEKVVEKTVEKPKAKKKRNYSFILTLAIIALIGYFVVSIISLEVKKSEVEQELAAANQTLSEKQVENEELQEILDSGDNTSYIERIARDVLGYVLPGERVYYDITTGDE